MSDYFYKQTESGLWTVGTGEGKDWLPESDHDSSDKAAERVRFLNGGNVIPSLINELNILRMALEKSNDLLLEVFESGSLPNHAYSFFVRRIDSRIHRNAEILKGK